MDHKTRVLKSESLSLKNDDIDQSCPKALHQPLNKPYYNLRSDDIAGTKPAIAKFKTKREASNPLNPVYRLPSFEPLEPVIPKFIRDSINVDDIPGTRPKTFHQRTIEDRITNNVLDIDGARPKKEYLVDGCNLEERGAQSARRKGHQRVPNVQDVSPCQSSRA